MDNLDKMLANLITSKLVDCHNHDTAKDLRGVQIGIAVISSFNEYSYDKSNTQLNKRLTTSQMAEKYAKSIHDQWGIGDADCNNGIMLLISIKDRKLYFSTGSGVKKIITDTLLSDKIIPAMRPYMQSRSYDTAIITALNIIDHTLSYNSNIYSRYADNKVNYNNYNQAQSYVKDYHSNPRVRPVSNMDDLEGLIVVFLFPFFVLFLFLVHGAFNTCVSNANTRPRTRSTDGRKQKSNDKISLYTECKTKLQKIQEQAQVCANAKQKRFNQTSCPICLEDFDNEGCRTLILNCGHKYCQQCLNQWFHQSDLDSITKKCPICREKVAKKECNDISININDIENQLQPNGAVSNWSNNDSNYDNDDDDDMFLLWDLDFRLNRLKHYYPTYVDDSMVNRWSQSGVSGQRFYQDKTFIAAGNTNRVHASGGRYGTSATRSRHTQQWQNNSTSDSSIALDIAGTIAAGAIEGLFSFGGGSSKGGGGAGGGW